MLTMVLLLCISTIFTPYITYTAASSSNNPFAVLDSPAHDLTCSLSDYESDSDDDAHKLIDPKTGAIYAASYVETPLHTAARFGNAQQVATLLNIGYPIHEQDEDGNTPLHLAAQYRHTDIIQTLINHDKKRLCVRIQNNEGKTPLHYAAHGGLDVLQPLLHIGDDTKKVINLQDIYGSTALHYAASRAAHNNASIFTELLELGADPNIRDTAKGRTPLHWVQRMRKGSTQKGGKQMPTKLAYRLYAELLVCGADPRIKDNADKSVLDWALTYNRYTECQFLLNYTNHVKFGIILLNGASDA